MLISKYFLIGISTVSLAISCSLYQPVSAQMGSVYDALNDLQQRNIEWYNSLTPREKQLAQGVVQYFEYWYQRGYKVPPTAQNIQSVVNYVGAVNQSEVNFVSQQVSANYQIRETVGKTYEIEGNYNNFMDCLNSGQTQCSQYLE